MADYTQPDVVNKRVRFFDGQFLQDQDFIDEQKYHLDRERRLSRILAVRGIAEGLEVTTAAANEVTVSPGTAVDALGRVLLLAAPVTLRLPAEQFNKIQGIELHLVYQETPVDVAQTGSRSERRWDESPKIVAVAPDGGVVVAPEGAPATYDGPTVLLARLALNDAGAVTVDRTVARSSGLSVPGALGIGTTDPDSDLEIGAFDARDRYLTLTVRGGNAHRSGIKLWSGQRNRGYSVEFDERAGTGNGLHVRTHEGGADGITRLFVGRTGNVGIGTTTPVHKLAVSASQYHLQLRREPAEGSGGTQLFLELVQVDDPSPRVPEVFPSIRFHHGYRFWHRIEARGNGFHFKDGNLASDSYVDINARTIRAGGRVEVAGAGGLNVDLQVSGRMRSNNNDGGLWVSDNRFVGGHSTDQIGFWNGQWHLTVLPNGRVGIGTTSPDYRLVVGAATEHLQLRRENTQRSGGPNVFLELYQDDPSTAVPVVYPSIRFHHNNRFWHRIEAQGNGFHFRDGALNGNRYSDVRANAAHFASVHTDAVTTRSVNADSVTTKSVNTDSITINSITIGSVRIGYAELAILKKLASGSLEFDLYNVGQREYAYAADYAPYDNDRRRIFTWRPGSRVNQGRWRISYPS